MSALKASTRRNRRAPLLAAALAVLAAVLIFAVLRQPDDVITVERTGKNGGGFVFQNMAHTVSDPRKAFFVPYAKNPIIRGPNLYAPTLWREGGTWWNFFGGWLIPGQSNDDIYLSTTANRALGGGWSPPRTVVEHGIYTHVNDPSVVKRDATWYMALTTATSAAADDLCSLLTSADGVTWPQLTDRRYEIAFENATVTKCARPSLIWNAERKRWELYFDGQVNGGPPHVGQVATSSQPVPTGFRWRASLGPMVELDVKRVDDLYIASFRDPTRTGAWATRYATSRDGVRFADHGVLVPRDATNPADDCVIDNGTWAIDGTVIAAFLYGEDDGCTWTNHKIGIAYPQLGGVLRSGGVVLADRQALDSETQRIEPHGRTSIDRVQVEACPAGGAAADERIDGVLGDTFQVQTPSQSPMARLRDLPGSLTDACTP